MTREEIEDITQNTSSFVVGLFSISSLVLKVLSLIDGFKARKKKNEENKKLVEEKEQ